MKRAGTPRLLGGGSQCQNVDRTGARSAMRSDSSALFASNSTVTAPIQAFDSSSIYSYATGLSIAHPFTRDKARRREGRQVRRRRRRLQLHAAQHGVFGAPGGPRQAVSASWRASPAATALSTSSAFSRARFKIQEEKIEFRAVPRERQVAAGWPTSGGQGAGSAFRPGAERPMADVGG